MGNVLEAGKINIINILRQLQHPSFFTITIIAAGGRNRYFLYI
jgi:hypothetical protein